MFCQFDTNSLRPFGWLTTLLLSACLCPLSLIMNVTETKHEVRTSHLELITPQL